MPPQKRFFEIWEQLSVGRKTVAALANTLFHPQSNAALDKFKCCKGRTGYPFEQDHVKEPGCSRTLTFDLSEYIDHA
ncbi:hypothetical protein NC653_014357 [Populus alba x Populus x berolinensis]|uniref:Uncharacterized protein n=1 Tax=Populus alba x Populus x berolinensis TaxID=444605 RepID=A0AAD6QWV4_9ROSI|nr:hypothetical protein NC653_014357 [Populus alba x Populus x berolinensis]